MKTLFARFALPALAASALLAATPAMAGVRIGVGINLGAPVVAAAPAYGYGAPAYGRGHAPPPPPPPVAYYPAPVRYAEPYRFGPGYYRPVPVVRAEGGFRHGNGHGWRGDHGGYRHW